jgi:spermidine/putrescine transport system permease protein
MTTLHQGAAARPRVDRSLAIWGWLVFAFLYLPIMMVVVFSFSGAESVGKWGGFSLRWYEQMLGSEQLLNSLENSVVVALISTVVATVLGTAAALSLDRYRRWVGRGAFDGLLYLPVIIPDVTMAVMLLLWFTSTGVIPLGRGSITLAHIAFNISFVAIVVRARLAHMDPLMEDAAADLYANRWQAFRRVTLPLIMPGVLGGALLALTLSLDDVVITSFVQGPGSTTLPVYVFGLIRRTVTPVINAVSTLMIVVSMVLVLASLLIQGRTGRRTESKEKQP